MEGVRVMTGVVCVDGDGNTLAYEFVLVPIKVTFTELARVPASSLTGPELPRLSLVPRTDDSAT